MSDNEIIMIMAKTWLKNGGDGEGFSWLQYKIQEQIKELEKEI